jgi:hypothetical protein
LNQGGLKIRCDCRNSTDDYSVRVTDFSSNLYYSQTPTTSDIPDGVFYVGDYVINDTTNRMAWYIYDKIATDAYDYLLNNVGWDNSYNVQVRWSPTNTSDGTHYHPGGSIDLLSGDRWDEDVLLHEYGHFVMYKVYGSMPSSPNCNPHNWGTHSSQGCAWVEGWANFIQGAIQGHQDYIDTEDITLHYYLEAPSPWADHPEDEGAVAASLWDIFDSGVESHDSLQNGIGGIWNIFRNNRPGTTADFWNGWSASANGSNCQVATILRHHVINYGTPCSSGVGNDTVGVYRPSTQVWYLRNANSSGSNTVPAIWYGANGDTPVVGDWDGNGTHTIGVYRSSTQTWYLRNSNSSGYNDIPAIRFGASGDIPVVGDWDGNGTWTIGVYRPSTQTWYLRNSNSSGYNDIPAIRFGASGDIPVVGDWDGNGTWTIGVYRPSTQTWYLRNSNSSGYNDIPAIRYGASGDTPVVGDWNGDRVTTIGIFRPSTQVWYLRNTNSTGSNDVPAIAYGANGDVPLGGDWDGQP